MAEDRVDKAKTERVVFLIDGFNIFHSLDEDQARHKYKWLDLKTLCSLFVKKNMIIEDVYYFTALATWDPGKEIRHKLYIKALRHSGVNPIYGKFKRKDRKCRICKRIYKSHEEKLTDVNIAIYLLKLALLDKYDSAIIVSGDTDLIPGIEAVQELYPAKKIGIIFPIGRSANDLKNLSDLTPMKIKIKHLKASQFPETVMDSEGNGLKKPIEWQ